jgi:hypothetical protein
MKLDLNINEVNAILACLGRAPFEVVFALIENIKKQATDQALQSPPIERTPESDK